MVVVQLENVFDCFPIFCQWIPVEVTGMLENFQRLALPKKNKKETCLEPMYQCFVGCLVTAECVRRSNILDSVDVHIDEF